MFSFQTFFQDDPKKKAEICKNQDPKFKKLNEILGKNQFLAGKDITIADFVMYDVFKWYNELDSSLISKYPNIIWYLHRFENVPKIKSFLSGPSYMKNFFVPIAVYLPLYHISLIAGINHYEFFALAYLF